MSAATTHAQVTFTQETGTNNPLNAADVGFLSSPAFVDIDGDGDFDVFVSSSDGVIHYYKNTGNATTPVFAEQTGSANPLNGITFAYGVTPVFVDIDGDGDKDLFIGRYDGAIDYYKNTGNATNPVFTLETGSNNPLNGVTVANYATPAFVDIDGDGDFDVVIGEGSGTIEYYQNTGTASAPVFTQQTGGANPFSTISVGSYSAPAFADLDGDGDFDLIVGSDPGTFAYYTNTGTPSAPAFTLQSGTGNPFNGFSVGFDGIPNFVDIDGDGDQDLFSGAYDGTIYYFKNTTGALPLHLISFNGIKQDGFNRIQWTTSAEFNTKSFELEHSGDGITFTKIATVAATGNASNSYSAVDNDIVGGKIYYRLKMIDIDGRYTYSQVIWINNGNSKGIIIYPNPASNAVNINMGYLHAFKTRASVYNADGKLMQNIEISNNQVQIDISQYAKGKYFIRFADGAVRSFIKN